MNVEVALEARATLGEGPLWDTRRQRLYWVDIEGGLLHVFNPADGSDKAHAIGQRVSTVVVRRRGGLLLGLEEGIASYDPDTGALELICRPEGTNPDVRFNDGKCDPAGRFWAGTMTFSRTPGGANLWRLDTDLSVQRMLDGVTTSNGLVWSLDRDTMYYIDSGTPQVDAFDFDLDSGQISHRRTVVRVPESQGKPDGMAIDQEGKLWVAQYRGGRVCRWDPVDGRLLQTIAIPASLTTACALGGANLDELFVTTARDGLTPEQLAAQPHAGSLFRVRVAVPGLESHEFAG